MSKLEKPGRYTRRRTESEIRADFASQITAMSRKFDEQVASDDLSVGPLDVQEHERKRLLDWPHDELAHRRRLLDRRVA